MRAWRNVSHISINGKLRVLGQVSRMVETSFSLHWPFGGLGISGRCEIMQRPNNLLIVTGCHQLDMTTSRQGMVMPQLQRDLHLLFVHWREGIHQTFGSM